MPFLVSRRSRVVALVASCLLCLSLTLGGYAAVGQQSSSRGSDLGATLQTKDLCDTANLQRSETENAALATPSSSGTVPNFSAILTSNPDQQLDLGQFGLKVGETVQPAIYVSTVLVRVDAGSVEYAVCAGEAIVVYAAGSSITLADGSICRDECVITPKQTPVTLNAGQGILLDYSSHALRNPGRQAARVTYAQLAGTAFAGGASAFCWPIPCATYPPR